jgi:hypothetical protein
LQQQIDAQPRLQHAGLDQRVVDDHQPIEDHEQVFYVMLVSVCRIRMWSDPVLRIRIRKDPHHFAGSGSAPKPMDPDPDPDADPTLFHTKLRKDVLQMN